MKTVRPRAPCGIRCMGHAVRTWSAVCSMAPQAHFKIGASRFQQTWSVPGYENTEPGCVSTVLRVSSVIRPLRTTDA